MAASTLSFLADATSDRQWAGFEGIMLETADQSTAEAATGLPTPSAFLEEYLRGPLAADGRDQIDPSMYACRCPLGRQGKGEKYTKPPRGSPCCVSCLVAFKCWHCAIRHQEEAHEGDFVVKIADGIKRRCPGCGKRDDKTQVLRNLAGHGILIPRFMCEHCGKRVAAKANLDEHMTLMHPALGPAAGAAAATLSSADDIKVRQPGLLWRRARRSW